MGRRLSEEELKRRAFLRGRADSQARMYNKKVYKEWYPGAWKWLIIISIVQLQLIETSKENGEQRVRDFKAHHIDYKALYRTEESKEASLERWTGMQLKERCQQPR